MIILALSAAVVLTLLVAAFLAVGLVEFILESEEDIKCLSRLK